MPVIFALVFALAFGVSVATILNTIADRACRGSIRHRRGGFW